MDGLDQDVNLIPNEKEYMEKYINPDSFVERQREKLKRERAEAARFPSRPERDVMGFLMNHAPLRRWQRDVLDMLREEAYYFAPQAMTKIMNEGWASYWHAKLMCEKVMESSELIDFCDRHSGVMATSKKQLNPYKLGIELFRHLETRWNKGQFGKEWDDCDDMAERRQWDRQLGLGQEKIFQVRKLYCDVTFIDEFLTEDFCRKEGSSAYEYDKKRQEWVIDTREFKAEAEMLTQLTNFGQPLIAVVDANHDNRGELLLQHTHEGVDLDVNYCRETLKNVQAIWGRPVCLATTSEDKNMLYRFDGENFKENEIKAQV